MTTATVRPPGPPFNPLVALKMLDRDVPPRRFRALGAEFPRLAYLRLGKQHGYLVSDPDLARQVLVGSNRQLEKGPALRSAGLVLGNGLLTLPSAEHKPRRRLVNPSFHHSRLAGYAAKMVEATADLDRAWAQLPEGTVVDMAEQMSALTLAIVGKTLFDADLGGAAGQVYRDLDQAMSGWEKLMLPGGDKLLHLPLPVFRRMWAAAGRLDGVVRGLVGKAAAQRGNNVVSELLDAEIDGERLPTEAVRDEAMTLMLAGHETTANALAWAWHLLAQNPGVAQRLWGELSALGTAPAYDDLRQLPWTMACVAETLRLYPPAWVLEREVTEALELDGYLLPVGSIVLVSQYALHRDPRWWDRPEEFAPERWLTPAGEFSEDAPGQPKGAWFPFGAGTRVCIGESFAWTEVALVLGLLARSWAPMTLPTWRGKLHAAVTLRPKGGLPMTLNRRG